MIEINKEGKHININSYSPCHNNSHIVKNKYKYNEFNVYDKDINDFSFDSPEELHYFYVKIFQKGKNLNFDKKNK